MENVNPEFAQSDSKNECRRTVNAFPPCLTLALGRWPFWLDFQEGAAKNYLFKTTLLLYRKNGSSQARPWNYTGQDNIYKI